MDALIRVARVVLLLALALIVVSLVIAVARPETGVTEKAALVALMGGCVLLAAKITDWAARLRGRFANAMAMRQEPRPSST